MSKSKVAEELAEKLQEYSYEVAEGEHENFYDDYIVDELLEMREIFYKDDVEEGHYYQSYTLTTDKKVRLYDTLTLQKALSGDTVNLKVMAIDSVTPLSEEKMIIEFLGRKVN